MAMAWMGAAAIVLFWLARLFNWPDVLKGLPVGMLLVSLFILLRRKLRDEYIQRLWVAGTSFSFAVLVVAFLLAPALEGLIDGLRGAAKTRDWPDIATPLAMFAFFVGFLATWLRDRA
ncbi:hypothetical protein EYB45_06550 [Erythrobacteraceae bacterium CFH 75059]|nr:hypothetical protein EYB45_06550 [Erythrobacteraceae bacterium CFH 75059]